MAKKLIGPDTRLWVAEHDFTGDFNAMAIDYSADPRDVTPFGVSTRRRIGGLKDVAFSGQGFWEGGDGAVDDALFGVIGVVNTPLSAGQEGGDVGSVVYLFRAMKAQYSPGAAIGEVFTFSVEAQATSGKPLVRGQILHNSTRVASGNEDGVQLGAVASGETLYAALHVVSASGTNPTLDVKIVSDDADTFGTPTDRITFAQATGLTSEWASVDGPITDDWFRVEATIGGTDPSCEFVVTAGII